MTVRTRPRTDEDDEALILKKRCTRQLNDDGDIVVPEPRTEDMVYWERSVDCGDVFPGETESKMIRWPLSTDAVCHQCCHPFDGTPVPLPESYDKIRKVYHCRGNFCSWQCAKAYNIRDDHTQSGRRGNRNMFIAILAHTTWTKYRLKQGEKNNASLKEYAMYNIYPPPPRENLVMFGGNMTIEEYRKGSFGIIPPDEAMEGKPFITHKQKLLLPFSVPTENSGEKRVGGVYDTESGISITRKIESSEIHKYSNKICHELNAARLGGSVIKREDVENKANTLMSTMGVVVEPRSS